MSICSDIQKIITNNLEKILALRNTKQLKEDNSFVSEGDLLCEKLVKDYLATLPENIYLISEEKNNDTFNFKDHLKVVIIDPIDGTENFVSGLKEWGIGVSVYENERHIESMIGLPELGLYLKTGDEFPEFESRIYGISSSLLKEDLLNLEEGFEYRIIGCSMYNMYNVITGSFAMFQNPKGAHAWDILPGLNLALENGCQIEVENKKYNGEFLYPNKKYRFKVKH